MSKFFDVGMELSRSNVDFEKRGSGTPASSETANFVVGSHFFKKTGNESSSFFSQFANLKEQDFEKDIQTQINAKKAEGYVFRALSDFQYKMLINSYYFDSENKSPVNQVKTEVLWKYFSQILINSSYIFETFMEELLKNFFHGNIYIDRKYKQKYLTKLLILPSVGWSKLETCGSVVTKFRYKDPNNSTIKNNSNGSTTFTSDQLYHLKFNNETHDYFGTPLLKPILEDVSSMREAENFDLENFLDASKSVHYTRVGDVNAPGTKKEVDEVSQTYASTKPGDHMVLNGKAKIETLSIPRIDGATVIENLKRRVSVGSGASKSVMGDSSVGRQTADTESDNVDTIVSTFQTQICNQLNATLFFELNRLLFPKENDLKNFVFLKPNDPFNILERKEKHNTLLWQGGAIDQTSFETRMGYKLNTKTTYPKIFEAPAANSGSVSQKSAPANQHGKKSSSKKSTKN